MHCIVFECFSDFGYMILISVIITDSLLLILCIPIMHTYQFEEEVHWRTLAVVRLCTVTSVQVPCLNLKTSSVLNTLRQTERELGKWLSNDDDKFDWSVFFKYVAVLEGKRCNIFMSIYIRLTDFYPMTVLQWILIWLERTWRETVRSTIKEVVPCDVLKDPVMDHPSQPFDALLTTLCIKETCVHGFWDL